MIIKSADMALEQSEEALRGIDWSAYGDILMIGKSIGTIAGSKYARRYGIDCRQIHFSPAEETFEFAGEKGIVFHGTVDRWVDTKVVERRCAEKELSLYEIEGANHSLEKGDVEFDIETIKKTMRIIREYALSRYADKIANDLQNAAVTLLADNPDKMPQTDDSTAIFMTRFASILMNYTEMNVLATSVWRRSGVGPIATGDVIENGFLLWADSYDDQTDADRAAHKAMPVSVALTMAGSIESIVITVNLQI